MVKVNAPLCALGEGPLWHSETNEFVFTDIINGLLYAWSPKTRQCRKLLNCEYQLGAFLFDIHGDLILFTEAGVFHRSYENAKQKLELLFPMKLQPGERFNDAICTPDSHMIAGTKTAQNQNGTLYLFRTGQPPIPIMKKLEISNGMGFSNDGSIFYHTDSGRRKIYQYKYVSGISGNPLCLSTSGGQNFNSPIDRHGPFGEIVWEETGEDQAVPDGMTVDNYGNIWTALWGRGCVYCIDPISQKILEEFRFPARQVSSVAFGGSNLQYLLITSASVGTNGLFDGETYYICTNTSGKEEYRYRL